jgi:hypothetical protein
MFCIAVKEERDLEVLSQQEVAHLGEQYCRRLAFMDDLNIVAVRIKHPGRIIARIVFGTGLRWFLTLSSSC